MQLSVKQYQIVKLFTVFLLAIVFSQSMVFKNFFIPVTVLLLSSLFLFYLRKRVKGVMADERDYEVAGKSAGLALQIYAWIAVSSMFLLYSLAELNPYYEAIAMTLAFSTVILMLLNAVIFRYYNKFKFSDKKWIFSFLILLLFIVLAFSTLRVFSGEDSWVCENGQWLEHGHPDYPAPTIKCE